MKFVNLFAAACLALALFQGCGKGSGTSARPRPERQALIAAAPPEALSARYVLEQAAYGPEADASGAPNPLPAMLKARGWIDASSIPLAWCPATKKGAFFRHGWIWVCDEGGRVLKSVWFEPDLKANGALQWSKDGTQLRLRADGWRHWLNLDLSAE